MVCRYVEIRCQVNVSGIMVWISHKNQARANNVERNPKCTHMNHKFIAIIVIMHTSSIERSSSTGLHHWARPALDPGSLMRIFCGKLATFSGTARIYLTY